MKDCWGKLTRTGGEEVDVAPLHFPLVEEVVFFGRIAQPPSSDSHTHKRQHVIPAPFVSSVHFSLSRVCESDTHTLSHYLLCDYSRNGTFLNGELVGARKTRTLREGDEVSLRYKNKVCIVYTFSAVSASVSASPALSASVSSPVAVKNNININCNMNSNSNIGINNNNSNNNNNSTTNSNSNSTTANANSTVISAANTNTANNNISTSAVVVSAPPKNTLADSLSAQLAVLQEEARQTQQRLLAQTQQSDALTLELEKCQRRLKSEERERDEAAKRERELREQTQAMHANRTALEARIHILEAAQEDALTQTRELKQRCAQLQEEVRERERQLSKRESLLQESTRALQTEQSVRVQREEQLQRSELALLESELSNKRLTTKLEALQSAQRVLEKELSRWKKRYSAQSEFLAKVQTQAATHAQQASQTLSQFSLVLQSVRGLEDALQIQHHTEKDLHTMLAEYNTHTNTNTDNTNSHTQQREKQRQKRKDRESISESPFGTPLSAVRLSLSQRDENPSPFALAGMGSTQVPDYERERERAASLDRKDLKRAFSCTAAERTDDEDDDRRSTCSNNGDDNNIINDTDKRARKKKKALQELETVAEEEEHDGDEEENNNLNKQHQEKEGKQEQNALNGGREDDMHAPIVRAEDDVHELMFESTQVPFSALDTLEEEENKARDAGEKMEVEEGEEIVEAKRERRDEEATRADGIEEEEQEEEKRTKDSARDRDRDRDEEEQTMFALERTTSRIEQLQPPFPSEAVKDVSLQNVDFNLLSQDSAMRMRSSGTRSHNNSDVLNDESALSVNTIKSAVKDGEKDADAMMNEEQNKGGQHNEKEVSLDQSVSSNDDDDSNSIVLTGPEKRNNHKPRSVRSEQALSSHSKPHENTHDINVPKELSPSLLLVDEFQSEDPAVYVAKRKDLNGNNKINVKRDAENEDDNDPILGNLNSECSLLAEEDS